MFEGEVGPRERNNQFLDTHSRLITLWPGVCIALRCRTTLREKRYRIFCEYYPPNTVHTARMYSMGQTPCTSAYQPYSRRHTKFCALLQSPSGAWLQPCFKRPLPFALPSVDFLSPPLPSRSLPSPPFHAPYRYSKTVGEIGIEIEGTLLPP